MIKNLYCVYDRVAKIHHAPIMLNNNEEAVRSFKMSANPNDIMLKDLELYKIGEFDMKSGNILPRHEHVIDGAIIALELQSKLLKETKNNVLQRNKQTTNHSSEEDQ